MTYFNRNHTSGGHYPSTAAPLLLVEEFWRSGGDDFAVWNFSAQMIVSLLWGAGGSVFEKRKVTCLLTTAEPSATAQRRLLDNSVMHFVATHDL